MGVYVLEHIFLADIDGKAFSELGFLDVLDALFPAQAPADR